MMLLYLLLGLAQATTKEKVMDNPKANVELDTDKDAAVSMHDEGNMADSAGDLSKRIDKMFARMDKMQENLEALVTASERRGPVTSVNIIPGATIQPDAYPMLNYGYHTSPPCLDDLNGRYNTTNPCVRSDCLPACQVLAKATCRCEVNGQERILATREGSPGNPGSCGYTQMDVDRSYVPTLCVAWRGSEGFLRWSNAGQSPPLCSTCEAWASHRTTPAAEDWGRDHSPNVGEWGANGVAGPTYYTSADGSQGSFVPPTR